MTDVPSSPVIGNDAPLLPSNELATGSRWPLVLVLVLTVVVLGRLCTAEFTMWDDPWTVAQNPHLSEPIGKALVFFWNPGNPQFGLFIPVTDTAWRLIAAGARVQTGPGVSILNPWIFHGANLLLHLIAVVLVWKVIRQFVENDWAAAAGAAVFAIHPVQVEAVAWVSGLKDVLCGLWTMAAILLYLRAGEEPHDSPGASAGASAVASPGAWAWPLVCFVLAILSKPGAMTVPLSLTAIELLAPANRRPGMAAAIGRLAPYYLIAIVVAIYSHALQGGPDLPDPPLWARPLIVCDALTFYAKRLVWPVDLTIDYDRTPDHVLGGHAVWFCWVLPAVVAALCWVNRRRRPAAVLAVCFFVFGCLPNLGWTRFLFQYYSTVADHYLYPSMLGVGLGVALLLQWAAGFGAAARRVAAVVMAVLVGACAVVSYRQAGVWADDASLFGHALAVNQDSFLAQNNYGVVLEQGNDAAGALAHFRRSIELRPTHFNAWRNLAIVEAKLDRHVEAIADIRRAMELELRYPPESRMTAQDQELLDRELAKLKQRAPATTQGTATKSAGG